MTMHDTGDDGVLARLEREAWLPDEDAMSLAIHKVYCGIMADHEHPNDKDREQARQLIAALGQTA